MANRVSNAQSDSVKEVWLPVVGWEGLYEVSDRGRVKSLDRVVKVTCGCGQGWITREVRGRVLKGYVHLGYPSVQLARDGIAKPTFVHRIVCEAFHGPCPPDKKVVAHNDGNPGNSVPGNLRWATVKENVGDTFLHGRLKRGIDAFGAKLNDAAVQEIRRNANDSIYDLADRFGVQPNHIHRVIRGEIWPLPSEGAWDGEWLEKGDRAPRWKLTLADKAEILANTENKTVAELAEQYGITDKRIYQLRSDHSDRKRPRSRFTEDIKKQVVENPHRLSNIDLAERLGITARQVASIRYWATSKVASVQ